MKSERTPESMETAEFSRVTTESWLKPHIKFRLERILVPVDFTEPSEKALRYAISIAEEFGSEILLLAVVHPYPTIPDMPSATTELTDALVSDAKLKLNKLKEQIDGAPCRVTALLGATANTIVEFAEKERADLIILGTHGRTGFAHAFLGSVAERVVQLATCPTLVVRAHEREFIVEQADDPALNRAAI